MLIFFKKWKDILNYANIFKNQIIKERRENIIVGLFCLKFSSICAFLKHIGKLTKQRQG